MSIVWSCECKVVLRVAPEILDSRGCVLIECVACSTQQTERHGQNTSMCTTAQTHTHHESNPHPNMPMMPHSTKLNT
eukprot:m.70959 g.70959  ORF g.70959 m.70959 type:complete len:77 (+) comp12274_c0_seq1:3175-3405(+)